MKLIVGLGNPGRQYENTRHNVGFRVIDRLAEKLDCTVEKEKYKALIGECRLGGEKLLLVKPQTYMNLSGEAAAALAGFYKIEAEDIITVYDDLALETGRLRIRTKGSHGGHNGMRSIIALLKTEKFARVRIGIGKPQIAVSDYVLGRFSPAEEALIAQAVAEAAEAVMLIIEKGIDKAMNRFN